MCDFIAKRTGKKCHLPPTSSGRCKRHTGASIWYTKEQADLAGVSYPCCVNKVQQPNALPQTKKEPKECCVCMEETSVVDLVVCSHDICKQCLDKLERRLCPVCRVKLTDYNEDVDKEMARKQREDVDSIASEQLATRLMQEAFQEAILRVIESIRNSGRQEVARYLSSLRPRDRIRFLLAATRNGW